MSTILKALQRLEDEKRARPEPTLDEQIAMPQAPESSGHRKGWVLVGSAVAGIAVAVVAIYFWIAPGSATHAPLPAVATKASPTRPAIPRETMPRPIAPAPAQLAEAEPDAVATVARSLQDPLGASTQSPTKLALEWLSAEESSRVEVIQRIASPAKPEPERVAPPVAPDGLASRKRPVVFASSAPKTRDVTSAGKSAVTQPRVPSTQPTQPTEPTQPVAIAQSKAPSPVSSRRPTAAKSKPAIATSPLANRPKTTPDKTPPTSIQAATQSEPTGAQRPIARQRAQPTRATPTPPSVRQPATGSAVAPDHKVVLRAKLPELKVRSTVWHPLSSRRMALVEVDSGEVLELREGDAVGPLVVESIKLSGVFFMHDGVSVLHKVGR